MQAVFILANFVTFLVLCFLGIELLHYIIKTVRNRLVSQKKGKEGAFRC